MKAPRNPFWNHFTNAVLLAPIKPTELAILAVLPDGRGPHDYANPFFLAEASGLSRATISRVIESLKGYGLVAVVEDAEDRRRIRVTVTPAGTKLLGVIHHKASTHEPCTPLSRLSFPAA